jgi:phosphopantetheine adenylyltransferase
LFVEKVLPELIEPVARRIAEVEAFIEDVRPTIAHRVTTITDMYGPSTIDPALQCIVLGPDVVKGGHMVNEERHRKVGCRNVFIDEVY